MKQNILIATLLAGMLALAGCGGGSGSTAEAPDPLAEANAKIAELEGKDNRTQAQKDAEKKTICEAAGGMLDAAGECGPDTSMAEAMKAADASALYAAIDGAAIASKSGNAPSDAATSGKKSMGIMGKAFDKEYTSAPVAPGTGDDAGVYTLTALADNNKIAGMGFAEDAGTVTHDKKSGPVGAKYFETKGSYHGVSGTYQCTGNPCTSIRGLMGITLGGGGTWTFTPDNAKDPVTDSKGIEWGFWVTKDNAAVHIFHRYVSGGGLDDTVTGLGDFKNTATYKGKAIGQYAVYRGTGGDNKSGAFEADAELTANFGGNADRGLSGKIYNFDVDSSWMVELRDASVSGTPNLTAAGVSNPPTNHTIWKMSDDAGDAVETGWAANMHEATSDNASNIPTHVTGGFKAEYENVGRMIGAFGAELESN